MLQLEQSRPGTQRAAVPSAPTCVGSLNTAFEVGDRWLGMRHSPSRQHRRCARRLLGSPQAPERLGLMGAALGPRDGTQAGGSRGLRWRNSVTQGPACEGPPRHTECRRTCTAPFARPERGTAASSRGKAHGASSGRHGRSQAGTRRTPTPLHVQASVMQSTRRSATLLSMATRGTKQGWQFNVGCRLYEVGRQRRRRRMAWPPAPRPRRGHRGTQGPSAGLEPGRHDDRLRHSRPGTWFRYLDVNADGSGQRRVTNDPARQIGAAWSPDGTQIAIPEPRRPLGLCGERRWNRTACGTTRRRAVCGGVAAAWEPNPLRGRADRPLEGTIHRSS